MGCNQSATQHPNFKINPLREEQIMNGPRSPQNQVIKQPKSNQPKLENQSNDHKEKQDQKQEQLQTQQTKTENYKGNQKQKQEQKPQTKTENQKGDQKQKQEQKPQTQTQGQVQQQTKTENQKQKQEQKPQTQTQGQVQQQTKTENQKQKQEQKQTQPQIQTQIKKIEPPQNPEIKAPNKPVQETQKALPNIQKFQFSKSSEKMLEGKSSTQKSGGKDIPSIQQADCFDNLGVVSLWYQNACYTDGNYNNNNFKIQKGAIANRQAYKIHPPAKKFTKFLASEHCISFKLSDQNDYSIYRFQDGSLDIAAQLQKKNVKANSWNLITNIKISQIQKPVVYLVIPTSEKLTPFTNLGKDIQGGTVYKDNKIRIQLIKFPLPNEPPVPEKFSHGPNSHYNCYNPNRDLFYISAKGKQYLVWGSQDKKNAYLTEIARKEMKVNSIPIKGKIAGFQLAGACGNEQMIYYSQIQSGPAASQDGTRKMELVMCDYNGNQKKKELVNTDKNNLNIYNFDTCKMVFNGNQIGMIVSRKMTRSNDGLNHQGAYAAVFDSNTLKMVKALGQTSSHSFSNSLIQKNGGGFLGMDLADNYPRGINFWQFDATAMNSKLVYSFKTLHGNQAKSPAGKVYPQYPEISKNGQKFYKWSNDNKTYTQLAAPGIVDHSTGNIIIFAGQNQPRALDNSQTGTYNNCSRNIGFVKTSKDITGPIISEGVQQTGGFFTFNGEWQELKNKGVRWLTKFADGQNASRVKSIGFDDSVFIIFQLWTKDSYVNTQYMIVDSNGKILTANTVIPYKIRFQKSDDIYRTQKSVVIYAGGKGKILNRFEIFIQK